MVSSESSVLDEEPGLESQLKKLRQTIREERRQVTQAAIQLGDERRKLSVCLFAPFAEVCSITLYLPHF